MVIRNLKYCSLAEIMDCFEQSFAGYFVQMNFDTEYWRKRFSAARVNFELSYGLFDGEKLVAFIINGIDSKDNILTAYNTGTGVLPAYRGNHYTDKIYAHAILALRGKGIKRFLLEVITDNHTAIRVYERIGFRKSRLFRCYKGALKTLDDGAFTAQIPASGELSCINSEFRHFYSWDNCNEAIEQSGGPYKIVKLTDATGTDTGFFIINPENGYLAQFEVYDSCEESWRKLFSAVSFFSKSISIKNIDESRTNVIEAVERAGLRNYINQYEMEMV